MITAYQPLLEWTARELMSHEVITIPHRTSLRAAAHLLAQAGIGGAPVTDDSGRCVGVLSARDLMNWLDQRESSEARQSAPCFCNEWQEMDENQLPADTVERYMTTDLVTAQLNDPIGRLARMMLDAHIHRVIVLDEQERPVGIVSSTDILAAVAQEARRGTAANTEPDKQEK